MKLNEVHKENRGCTCCKIQQPIYISALIRTLKIFGFVFIVTYVMNLLIHEVSEEVIGQIVFKNSFLQVFLASMIGFIPNCAASVVLTQLFVIEQISFGALLSGLITNAGLGIVVLLRYGIDKKELLKIVSILVVTAWVIGYIV